VDETRELERVSTWSNPAEYARAVARSYRRDFWDQQPRRVMVVSEKATVRGLLRPVVDEFAVGFQVMHGFSSATIVHDISEDDDGRPLIILYVGDFDPSGMYMSERPADPVLQIRRQSRDTEANRVDAGTRARSAIVSGDG
jgi:hypothetical protein